MLVGVYGIAYYFASTNPEKYWALILVGFVGKVLGPIGAVYYVVSGKLDTSFLLVNVFNDLIWLFPFGWVLYQVLKGNLSPIKTEDERTLYQKFLGEEFENLSPNLKKFHGAKETIGVLGEFKVTRGTNIITNTLADIADLPENANSIEAELTVAQLHGIEIWNRRLGDKKVLSKQWLEGEFLVERFKIVRIYLTADVNDGDLIIYDVASTILFIPMPPFLTPTVRATGKDVDDGVAIEVEIGFKPFGRIINYKGVVR